MGLMSWMWGGNDAGRTPARNDNPWRRLYDPGTPPNPAQTQGAKYYDTVQGPAPSVWDNVLKSEEFQRRSFDTIDADHDGFIDQEELQHAVGPGPDAARMVAEADKKGRGKISRHDYDQVMRGHFGTA
ncbi:MAG: hypothetical protein J3K34DRAFT_413363 [Monoraphidium minutum]|nr:MAG: hypothetical protein J3K34DRAFT_413363 [Monoraphidium minutum]